MSLTMNMVGGGPEPSIFIVVMARTSSNTMGAPTTTWSMFDENYFSRGDGTVRFYCQKAGRYRIRASARSAYGQNSSSRTTCTVRIFINGSYGTREITSSESSSAPTTADYIVDLAVGDLVVLNARNSGTNVIVDANMVITAPLS